MTLQSLKDHYTQSLKDHYTPEEINFIFYAVAEKLLRKDRAIIKAGLHENWQEAEENKMLFDAYLLRLQSGEPYQYVVGEAYFMDTLLKVDKNVLIPRPETEELVEWILNNIPDKENFNANILDIGTGSGCIAIALKKHLPNANIYALDISEKALEVARLNATLNDVSLHFLQKDILKDDLEELPYWDIIVSNPPYIPQKEKDTMPGNVTQFEPENALFVSDENPIEFYFEISQLGQDRLKPGGKIYVEIHQNLMEENKKMFEAGFGKVEVKKDISGNWRMLKAEQPYTCG